jgi:hypothetical protein
LYTRTPLGRWLGRKRRAVLTRMGSISMFSAYSDIPRGNSTDADRREEAAADRREEAAAEGFRTISVAHTSDRRCTNSETQTTEPRFWGFLMYSRSHAAFMVTANSTGVDARVHTCTRTQRHTRTGILTRTQASRRLTAPHGPRRGGTHRDDRGWACSCANERGRANACQRTSPSATRTGRQASRPSR